MANFKTVFLAGKEGKNVGLTTGIPTLDRAINGLQKKTSIGLAAAPKCGKTTMVDFCFVLSPYLQMLKLEKLDNVRWIYFSYEVDRVSKEFKYAAFFMFHDYKIFDYEYKGKKYLMDQDYLMGRKLSDDNELIPISEDHELKLKEIYAKWIVPLFGEYDENGNKIRQGKIEFIEDPENPTGSYKYLMNYAKQNGSFLTESYTTIGDSGNPETRTRITGYRENNEELMTIVITDHVRKKKMERGFTLKQNIDKWYEYTTWLRNICQFTFINVCHSGRQLSNIDRLKYAGEYVYPTADDVKDSGNLAEESTILLTMFNPNDEKYNLQKHFDIELKDFPNYRSIHIADARYVPCPNHVQTNMFGGINYFQPIFPKK